MKHHSEETLCFLFFGLTLGAAVTYLLSRYAQALPYTLVQFVLGVIIAQIYFHFGVLGDSIDQWLQISPHLLLFVFLPALLFGEAMNLKIYHIKAAFSSSVLMAGPGAIFGAYALAFLCIRILPYNWSWALYLELGAILCATDPVAVVSLLKSVKASPNLTMVVTSESLLNDGSALVLYNLFAMAISKTGEGGMSSLNVLIYFIRVIFISPLLGASFGLLTIFSFNIINRRSKADDVTIQVALSLCCAYLSFFVGEYVVHVSGVLTCCAAGIFISWMGTPLILAPHSMHNIWATVEWIGNTLIFLLAGLLFGAYIPDMNGTEVAMIFVVYLLLHVIRIVIVISAIPLYPLFGHEDKANSAKTLEYNSSPVLYYFRRMKYAMMNPNLIFLAWSGLRGAVSMALALALLQSSINGDTTCSAEDGRKLFTLVGGVAFLTLLINATTSRMLLEKLELIVVSSEEIETVRNYARKRIYQKLSTLVSRLDNIYKDVYPHEILLDVKEQIYNDRLQMDREFTTRRQQSTKGHENESNIRVAFNNSFKEMNKATRGINNSFASPDSYNDTAIKRRPKNRSDSIYTQRRMSLAENSQHEKGKVEFEMGKMTRDDGVDDDYSDFVSDNNSVRNDNDFDIATTTQYTPVKNGQDSNMDSTSYAPSNIDIENIGIENADTGLLNNSEDNNLELGALTSDNLFKLTISAPVVADVSSPQRTILNQKLMMEVRVSFLEVLRSTYWKHISQNFFPRNSLVATILLNSVDFAQDNVYEEGFKDWEVIESFVSNPLTWILTIADMIDYIISKVKLCLDWMNKTFKCKCNFEIKRSLRERIEESHVSNCIYILTSFLDASYVAQQKIPYYMGDTSHADTPEEKLVIKESMENVNIAKNILENISSEIKVKCLVRQTERYISWQQEQMIEEFQEEGIILERDADVLLEESLFDHTNSKNAEWLQKFF